MQFYQGLYLNNVGTNFFHTLGQALTAHGSHNLTTPTHHNGLIQHSFLRVDNNTFQKRTPDLPKM